MIRKLECSSWKYQNEAQKEVKNWKKPKGIEHMEHGEKFLQPISINSEIKRNNMDGSNIWRDVLRIFQNWWNHQVTNSIWTLKTRVNKIKLC